MRAGASCDEMSFRDEMSQGSIVVAGLGGGPNEHRMARRPGASENHALKTLALVRA